MNFKNLPSRLIIRVKKLFTKSNRNLLKELTWSEFKLTDYNSILGILWSFLNPVLMLLVMYFIFRERFGQKIYAYPLYLLIGIVTVNFFISTTSAVTKVFSANRDFVLNTTSPRELVILSQLFVNTYKFIIELAVCLILSMIYGVFSVSHALLLLPLLLSYLFLILSFGFLLSMIYCFVRDVGYVWMLMSRLLLFVTPVFYKLNYTSEPFRNAIYWGNPITPFMMSFYEIIMNSKGFHIFNYLYALVLGFILLIFGYLIFLSVENHAMERV